MTVYLWIILASWVVFLGYWIFSSFNAKRNLNPHPGRWLGTRLLLWLILFLLARAGFLNHYTAYYEIGASHPVTQAIGALLSIIGIGLAVWARTCLGRNWGMPNSVKENAELVTSGPYAYVRHPIYTGILLAGLGSGLIDPGFYLIVIICGIYFIYSARNEEKLMQKEFPHEYPAYKKRTKMLVPFVI